MVNGQFKSKVSTWYASYMKEEQEPVFGLNPYQSWGGKQYKSYQMYSAPTPRVTKTISCRFMDLRAKKLRISFRIMDLRYTVT